MQLLLQLFIRKVSKTLDLRFSTILISSNFDDIADTLFYSDASTVMWPQTTQGHGQQQPSLSVVTTVWGVTSSMTNGTANMTHDPTNPGIPTTNTVNSVGHPYLSTSANPKQYAQSGKGKMNSFFMHGKLEPILMGTFLL